MVERNLLTIKEVSSGLHEMLDAYDELLNTVCYANYHKVEKFMKITSEACKYMDLFLLQGAWNSPEGGKENE